MLYSMCLNDVGMGVLYVMLMIGLMMSLICVLCVWDLNGVLRNVKCVSLMMMR